MRKLCKILNDLPADGRRRAVRYLADKFGVKGVFYIPPQAGNPEDWKMTAVDDGRMEVVNDPDFQARR